MYSFFLAVLKETQVWNVINDASIRSHPTAIAPPTVKSPMVPGEDASSWLLTRQAVLLCHLPNHEISLPSFFRLVCLPAQFVEGRE